MDEGEIPEEIFRILRLFLLLAVPRLSTSQITGRQVMKTIDSILAAAAASLLAGCSTTPIVLDPVGPPPLGAIAPLHEGYLKVFTATETHPDGDNTCYYPHTGYQIYGPDGKRFKWVENHVGSNDESPMVVALPEGNFKVKAQAEGFGWLTVPIVIKWRALTEVNLETSGRKRAAVTNEGAVVQLPNGYVVGWRAEPSRQTGSE